VSTSLVPIFTSHLHDHRAAVVELRLKHMKASGDAGLTESEELDRLLFQAFRGGRLHRAVSKSGSMDSELNYLRQVVSLVLPLICPKKEFSSPSSRLMLRELIVCKVLHPMLTQFADTDYINQYLEYFAARELVQQYVLNSL